MTEHGSTDVRGSKAMGGLGLSESEEGKINSEAKIGSSLGSFQSTVYGCQNSSLLNSLPGDTQTLIEP